MNGLLAKLILREENNKIYYCDYSIFGLGENAEQFHLILDFNPKVVDTLSIELPIFFAEDKDRISVFLEKRHY